MAVGLFPSRGSARRRGGPEAPYKVMALFGKACVFRVGSKTRNAEMMDIDGYSMI